MLLQLEITESEYTKAITTLVQLANRDIGSSKAAAQVLLAAYNDYNFQLELSDLRLLDPINMQAALTVISGRLIINEEPHIMFEGGREAFSKLEEEWSSLHVMNRYKKRY